MQRLPCIIINQACVLRGLTMQRLPCISINQACVLRNVCLQRGERAYELTYFSPDGRGYPTEYTFSLITFSLICHNN